ncbi:hypothetical protein IV417_06790 [Alphaproteobacteria bacterium KMM 3653]|uniref:Uncharacterized protein n=1 Tax=Harenicola maris TaxID=2841044 RepID=A0AAP2G3D6_9RHOB|nr:hypothetical protein [Harenicola maris]
MKLGDFLGGLVLGAMPFAAAAAEMRDSSAGFTMQVEGGFDWAVAADVTGVQSTVVAATPEAEAPVAMVTATTMMEKNPMAMMGGSVREKTTEQFLQGLCESFQCGDISGRTYEEIGGRKAWVVTTTLGSPGHLSLGLPEAVMIATVTPQGFMQLISLHTAEGGSAAMEPVLRQAFASLVYDAQ